MGSYGIGPARIAAAAVEQFADEQGISWPRAIAPFDIELVTLGKEGEEARKVADQLYEELAARGSRGALRRPRHRPRRQVRRRGAAGLPAATDPRQAQGIESGEVEVQVRRGQEKSACPSRGGQGCGGAVARPGLTKQLLGHRPLRRPASRDAEGQPLRPFTIPNLISYVRLALLPVFVAMASPPTTAALGPRLLYFAIAWGDQLDGLAARLTGQYSRLGALLDPLTDRALVLAGAIVCFHFELLPRWALVVLAARELFMLVLTQYGLRKGMDLKINMVGALGGVAGDVRDLPDPAGGQLGGRRLAVARAGPDAVGHGDLRAGRDPLRAHPQARLDTWVYTRRS